MSNTSEHNAHLRVPTFEPHENSFEEYAHVLGDTVRRQDKELAGLVVGHEHTARTHTAQYAQFLTQAKGSEASDLFHAVAGTVADDLSYTEQKVRRTIYGDARALEVMLSGEDRDTLRHARRAANEYGIGSSQYQEEIEQASCRAARRAIERIMDWPLLGKLREDSDLSGVDSHVVGRDLQLASPGAKVALKAAQDNNVFNAVHDKVAIRFESGGFGTRPHIDWHQVDRMVEGATPSVRAAIFASLDIHVHALAQHAMVSPLEASDSAVRRHLRHASNTEARLLIAKSVGWPASHSAPSTYDAPRPYTPYTGTPEAGPVRQRGGRRILAAAAAVVVAATAILSGIAVADKNPGSKQASSVAEGEIVPCFPTVKKLQTPSTDPANINVPVVNGSAEGSGVPSDTVVNRVEDDLVEVTANGWKGSGVIMQDAFGRQVVVTAAHVVGARSPGDLTITTQSGTQVHPTGGCYIYGKNGQRSTLTDPSANEDTSNAPIPDSDVAVLTLGSQLTNHPMPMASAEPAPGQRVDFVNYQAAYGPAYDAADGDLYPNPAAYQGIVTPTGLVDGPDLNVITGAEDMGPSPTNGDYESIHIEGGASGGPVVHTVNGQVTLVGISTAGTKTGYSFTPSDISTLYYTNLQGADTSPRAGFDPTLATVMPLSVIKRALGADVLKVVGGPA